MKRFDRAECYRFLLERPRTGKVGLVKKDGRALVLPIWFDVDGEDIVFNTGKDTAKGKILLRDPRLTMCVDDEVPPFAVVTLEGDAALDEDPAKLLFWATRIASRYMGPDLAEAYGKRNGVAGELIVRVRPTKISGMANVAD